ncbi:GIY-YIG catalytic domain-containing endonuclease [Paramecium bursaria Chlorella virus NW665.2]|nr:GIY-YIG catalytic domain-containing endonuclease [Paramecium bursaria Chlorella virus NW665.2]
MIFQSNFCVYNLISPSGKFYIGYSSLTAEERFECHVNNSRKTKSKCPAIEGAIRKHGAEKFKVITVRWCDTKEDACYWEEVYTKFFKTTKKKYGYNLKEGGLGGKLSEQGLANHREAMKNRIVPDMSGPRASTAEDIESAIQQAKDEYGPGATKRAIALFAADLLEVSSATVIDHMKRIGQEYTDGRRIATDDQIADELFWVMSMDFSHMMRKTLVMEMVGNIFGSSKIIMRRYWERHPNAKMINSRRIFTNDELNMVHSFALEFFEYNPPSRKKLAELISTIMDVSIMSIYKYM